MWHGSADSLTKVGGNDYFDIDVSVMRRHHQLF